MFIVSITYISEMSQIDKYLDAHIEYLDRNYERGVFIASGRKVPRSGGIILAKARNLSELEEILNDDPFKIHNLADYELTEFVPTKAATEFSSLIQ
ncbi:YciI family protein [Photobacterium leiognathi]|uniref:YciI family protein n=1 Tax=Photobacterium leiognathi TaxID=553611 RepID=UPI0027396F63|nr:YciI family protein [Photobacterium leiognathi]